MHRKMSLALIASLSLASVACSKVEDSAYRTPKELSEALLSVTDMPGGWQESQRQVFDQRTNENPSIDPSVWCTPARNDAEPLVTLAGVSGADVEMSKPVGGGKGASMMRLQAWSNKDVEEYFSTARHAVDTCNGISSTDSSGATSTTNTILDRTIGDESISFSQKVVPPASTQGEKFSSIGRTTIARLGNVLMVLQIGDAGPTSSLSLMNETQWWDIVKLAADKLD